MSGAVTNNPTFNNYTSLTSLSPEQQQLLVESSDILETKGYGIKFLDRFFQGFEQRYQEYVQNKFLFGADLDSLPKHVRSRSNQASINFIYDKQQIQESILTLIHSGASSEDIHNFLIMSQKIYEEKTGNTDTSPFIREFHQAAQKAASADPYLKAQLDQHPTNFIYHPGILEAAALELQERNTANTEVNSTSTRNSGILQRFQDFGFLESMTLSALISGVGFLGDAVTGNAFSKGGWLLGYSKKSGFEKALTGSNGWTKYFNGRADIDMAKKFGWDMGDSRKALERHRQSMDNFHKHYNKLQIGFNNDSARTKSAEFILPNGEKIKVESKEALEDAYKRYLKTNPGPQSLIDQAQLDIKNKIAQHKDKVKKASVKQGKFFTARRGQLWKTRFKAHAKYLPKRLGTIVGALAALGWGISQFSSNPNYKEPAKDLYNGTTETVSSGANAVYEGAKSFGQGTVNFIDNWFIPDNFSVLLFGPKREEYA